MTWCHAYNLPRARRIVTPAEYATLAARHLNLVATKNRTGEMGRAPGWSSLIAVLVEPGAEAAEIDGAPASGKCWQS